MNQTVNIHAQPLSTHMNPNHANRLLYMYMYMYITHIDPNHSKDSLQYVVEKQTQDAFKRAEGVQPAVWKEDAIIALEEEARLKDAEISRLREVEL